MSKSSPVILLDLDGTLIDSLPTLLAALNETLAALDRRPLTFAELRRLMGHRLAHMVAGALALTGDSVPVEPVLADMRQRYDVHCIGQVRPFPHVPAALDRLAQHHRLAVCTNKPRRPTEAILDRLGWTDRFESVAALGDTPAGKPDPSLVQLVLDQLHVSPDNALLVGDTGNDSGAAAAAGVRFFAAAWGYSDVPAEALTPHVAVLHTLGDLFEHL